MQPNNSEADEHSPSPKAWGQREGRLIWILFEALVHWPLFLHLLAILSLVWLTGFMQYNYPLVLLVALLYLHKVDVLQKERLHMQIQARIEEQRSRLTRSTESETVAWLNALLQECWQSWLERYFSYLIANCLHLNLNYYKHRTLSKLVIDHLRLGSSPPIIHHARVYRDESRESLVLELDLAFVAADDMRVELIARLKKASVGLGITGKLYGNNLRVEGKLRLGLKFVPFSPYLAQLTIAFATVPILGLSVRPLSSSSVDVTDLPGIASWVSKAIQAVVETCLVEPHPLVLDMIKLLGADYRFDDDKDGVRFMRSGDNKDAKDVGFVILEILEAKNLEAKERSGHPDPYVKIYMEKVKFKTSVKKLTVNPVWQELFRLRIPSWNMASRVCLRVRDRDSFGMDDELGHCEIEISQHRGGHRSDMWLKLQGVKTGVLHCAVTIVDLIPRDEIDEEEKCNGIGTTPIGCTSRKEHTSEEFGSHFRTKNVRIASSVSNKESAASDTKFQESTEKESHLQNRSNEILSPRLPNVAETEALGYEPDLPWKSNKKRFMFMKQRHTTAPTQTSSDEEKTSPSKRRSTFKYFYKKISSESKTPVTSDASLEVPSASNSAMSP